jgi:hypothetical protein
VTPDPDNILEAAERFLTKYVDQKDIPQAVEELDRVMVREGEFGCGAKLLQESSALTESEKRLVKSETGRVVMRQSRMSDGALAFRTCGTKLKTSYKAALRALESVPHSASAEGVCSAHKFVHSKVRSRLNNASVQRLMYIYINLRLVSKVAAELGDVFDCEEDLMMLPDGAVGMGTALDVDSSCVEEVV